MGLFTKNTLSADEAVDATTQVAILTIMARLLYNKSLSSGQRRDIFDKRIALRGKDASYWHKSKLCVAGDDVAAMLLSDPSFVQLVNSKHWGAQPQSRSDKEINEEIAGTVRRLLFSRSLI